MKNYSKSTDTAKFPKKRNGKFPETVFKKAPIKYRFGAYEAHISKRKLKDLIFKNKLRKGEYGYYSIDNEQFFVLNKNTPKNLLKYSKKYGYSL